MWRAAWGSSDGVVRSLCFYLHTTIILIHFLVQISSFIGLILLLNSLEDLATTSGSTLRWTPASQMFIVPYVRAFFSDSKFGLINNLNLAGLFPAVSAGQGIPSLPLRLGQNFSIGLLRLIAPSSLWHSGIAVPTKCDSSIANVHSIVSTLSPTVVWVHWQLLSSIPFCSVACFLVPVAAPVLQPVLPSWFSVSYCIILSLTLRNYKVASLTLSLCMSCSWIRISKATRFIVKHRRWRPLGTIGRVPQRTPSHLGQTLCMSCTWFSKLRVLIISLMLESVHPFLVLSMVLLHSPLTLPPNWPLHAFQYIYNGPGPNRLEWRGVKKYGGARKVSV